MNLVFWGIFGIVLRYLKFSKILCIYSEISRETFNDVMGLENMGLYGE